MLWSMVPDDGAYSEYLIGLGLAPRTVRVYERKVGRALVWFAAHDLDLGDAAARDVFTFASETANSNSTRVQIRCALKHWWQFRGVAGPADAVRVPPAPDMVCRALEADEAAAMVKVAVGWYPQGLAALFGLAMAMRREEIAAAQWSRFDPRFDWYTVLGKGDRTRRLPVHPVLAVEVRRLRRIDRNWIFPGRVGIRPHVHPATVWDWTKQVAETAGVEGFTTHRMRHTALAEMNDQLGDLRATMVFAGHRRPETTAGYTRTTARRLREASDSLSYLCPDPASVADEPVIPAGSAQDGGGESEGVG
jgi:integrase/recombinase XerC